MTVRYRYYVASSLDGFIADRDGRIDWLLAFGFDEFSAGYDAFVAEVGAIVMGRSTYDFLLGEGPDAWTYDQPAWVFTTRPAAGIPGRDVRFAAGSPADLRAELEAAAGGRDVWIVGGGPLAAQFAAAGMLDELIVSVMPVVLGAGAPLLPLAATESLALTSMTTFPSGAVELRYDFAPVETRRAPE